jgi:predicted AAA+ superfamily ATPase
MLLQLIEDLLKEGVPAANITFFDFDDDRAPRPSSHPDDLIAFKPDGLREDLPRYLFFDEIAGVENWASWLKRVVDQSERGERKLRVVVTDSVAGLLKSGGRESGTGRWNEHLLEPLAFEEFLAINALEASESPAAVLERRPYAVEEYLSVGGFPEYALAVGPTTARELNSRLRTDIADRAIYRDLARLQVDVERVRALFVYLMQDSGSIFDTKARTRWFEGLEGDRPPDTRSVSAWIDLLVTSMLVSRLDPHGGSAGARLRGRRYPKLFASDPGLVASFSSLPSPLEENDVRARLFEAAVFRHLRDLGSVEYCRGDSGESELDFVLPHSSVCIEVKSGTASRQAQLDLAERAKHWKFKRSYVIHAGPSTSGPSGVECLSLKDFLIAPKRVIEGAA